MVSIPTNIRLAIPSDIGFVDFPGRWVKKRPRSRGAEGARSNLQILFTGLQAD